MLQQVEGNGPVSKIGKRLVHREIDDSWSSREIRVAW
jgi:hypothetical protein